MLNQAAAPLSKFAIRALALAGFACLLAAPSLALEGIDLREVGEEAEGTCPKLVQIRHPFLCDAKPPADATWENSKRIPRQGDWTESDGAWGPSLRMEWD